MFSTSTDLYKNDNLVGSSSEYPLVIIGEHALSRVGLTTYRSSVLQLSTLSLGITGIDNFIAMWYFNPNAARYAHTKPSHVHPNILIPTQERALVEYMAFHDYFDEGILIEGINTYLLQHDNDYSKLLEEAEFWKYREDVIEYWVKEAIEDYEV